MGVISFLLRPPAVEAMAINWQKYTVDQAPIYPLDGDCYRYYNQSPLLLPSPSESGLWMVIKKISLAATTINHQIDIDIFEPSGGWSSLPDDPPNILPNFLTIRYAGQPFAVDYDSGLIIYNGWAKVKIVDGGTWCRNFDESSPIRVSYEVEYAFVAPAEASGFNEWFWSDPLPSAAVGDGWQIKGLFEPLSAGRIINLKGLYAYSTIPLTLSFALQGNAFIEQEYWSTSEGDDRIRYYQPVIIGQNSAGVFKIINHTAGELPGYARIFIHAWGKRDSGLRTIITRYGQTNGIDFAVFLI